jgi:Cu(I)/Ag(I) efflux system membrane protein CusA/SilA
MKIFKVDANIVALSGIAIAIGTIVDMGIVICENIIRHLKEASENENKLEVIHRASSEVAGAVLTAVATTVVGFLPVFTMTGPEGKLFRPLAFTKTFALIASVIVAITVIPPAAHILFTRKFNLNKISRFIFGIVLIIIGVIAWVVSTWWLGVIIIAMGIYRLRRKQAAKTIDARPPLSINILAIILVGIILTTHWMPLGSSKGMLLNLFFVAILIGGLLWFFRIFQKFYPKILSWCLEHKVAFLSIPTAIVITGCFIWAGLGKEFMPPLDEGSFLYMPTTMPHASIGEALDILQKQDAAFGSIPEVESVVGKIGRAKTPLDPAPVSMVETVINYKPQYLLNKDGRNYASNMTKRKRNLFAMKKAISSAINAADRSGNGGTT